MSNKNLKVKKSSFIAPQKEKQVKIQFVNNDWSLQLNKYLTELMKQYSIRENNCLQFESWKKNINGKPHKRLLELDTNMENEIIMTDHQKQISLKSIKELNFNEESDATPEMKGVSMLLQGMDTPIYYHFESEIMYRTFSILIIHSILKKSHVLLPSEEFCIFKIVSDTIMENFTQPLNANVGIPFHFSMESFDIFGNPITSSETLWNSILYKNNGYFTDSKKNRKVQKCDLISHSGNVSVFACTTNESGQYFLEISNTQDKDSCMKRFNMEFHPSVISFKNSHVCFGNGKSQTDMKAGESCRINLSSKDMFGNDTMTGFNVENIELHFFEKNSKSRWIWTTENQENERYGVNYTFEEQVSCFNIESSIVGQLEIGVFYKNEKTDSLIPMGVMENGSVSSVDTRLFCNVIAGSLYNIEILNLDDLKGLISNNQTTIKFKPVDMFGNEIKTLENIELEYSFKAENEELSNFLPMKKVKLSHVQKEEVNYCYFTPEWSGVYSFRANYNSKKLKEFSIEIHVNSSECELERMKALEQSETIKKLNEKKEKIEEEITNWCKFKTFRQVLNYVIENYHPHKDQHSTLLLHTTAERPEILRLYKKVIFIIHTDQSPLLKSNEITPDQSELITFELNTVFNAVQNAYQSWKKLA